MCHWRRIDGGGRLLTGMAHSRGLFRAGDRGRDFRAVGEVQCRVDRGVGALRESDEKDALERPRVSTGGSGQAERGEQCVKRRTRGGLETDQATTLAARRSDHCVRGICTNDVKVNKGARDPE